MTKNSIVFPDNDQYGFTQLTKDNNNTSLSIHKNTQQQQQQQQSLSTINNIQNLIKSKQQFNQFTKIQPEDLPLLSICKKKKSSLHNEIEVVYNHVQPSNVCQGCVIGHKFCYFETRGPKARLRRCTSCIEKHLSCVMMIDNDISKKMIPDPAGDLIIPLAFKHYFLQYRFAQNVLKHSSQISLKNKNNDNEDKIIREAKEVVQRFRPVSLQVLRKYPFGINKKTLLTKDNNNNINH